MTLNLILHTPHLFASPSRVTKAWGLARVPHLVSFKLSKEHTGDSDVHFLMIPLFLPTSILTLRTGKSDVQFLVSSGNGSSFSNSESSHGSQRRAVPGIFKGLVLHERSEVLKEDYAILQTWSDFTGGLEKCGQVCRLQNR